MLQSIFSPENVSLFQKREEEKVFLFIIAHSAELTHKLLKCTRTSSKKIVERRQLTRVHAVRFFLFDCTSGAYVRDRLSVQGRQ